jgi:hypothetical protein
MKRYIAAILIPCLLLQLCGCYSYREITIEELKSYKGENDIKIKTDKEELIINRKASGTKSMNWESNDSSITVIHRELILMKDSSTINTNDFKIKYDNITVAQIEEQDNTATLLLVVGIAAAGIYLIAAIAVSINGGVLGD